MKKYLYYTKKNLNNSIFRYCKKLDYSDIYPEDDFDDDKRIYIMNWLCEVLLFLQTHYETNKDLTNVFYKTMMIFDSYSKEINIEEDHEFLTVYVLCSLSIALKDETDQVQFKSQLMHEITKKQISQETFQVTEVEMFKYFNYKISFSTCFEVLQKLILKFSYHYLEQQNYQNFLKIANHFLFFTFSHIDFYEIDIQTNCIAVLVYTLKYLRNQAIKQQEDESAKSAIKIRFNELIEKIMCYESLRIPQHFNDILKRIKEHRDDFIMFMQDQSYQHLQKFIGYAPSEQESNN